MPHLHSPEARALRRRRAASRGFLRPRWQAQQGGKEEWAPRPSPCAASLPRQVPDPLTLADPWKVKCIADEVVARPMRGEWMTGQLMDELTRKDKEVQTEWNGTFFVNSFVAGGEVTKEVDCAEENKELKNTAEESKEGGSADGGEVAETPQKQVLCLGDLLKDKVEEEADIAVQEVVKCSELTLAANASNIAAGRWADIRGCSSAGEAEESSPLWHLIFRIANRVVKMRTNLHMVEVQRLLKEKKDEWKMNGESYKKELMAAVAMEMGDLAKQYAEPLVHMMEVLSRLSVRVQRVEERLKQKNEVNFEKMRATAGGVGGSLGDHFSSVDAAAVLCTEAASAVGEAVAGIRSSGVVADVVGMDMKGGLSGQTQGEKEHFKDGTKSELNEEAQQDTDSTDARDYIEKDSQHKVRRRGGKRTKRNRRASEQQVNLDDIIWSKGPEMNPRRAHVGIAPRVPLRQRLRGERCDGIRCRGPWQQAHGRCMACLERGMTTTSSEEEVDIKAKGEGWSLRPPLQKPLDAETQIAKYMAECIDGSEMTEDHPYGPPPDNDDAGEYEEWLNRVSDFYDAVDAEKESLRRKSGECEEVASLRAAGQKMQGEFEEFSNDGLHAMERAARAHPTMSAASAPTDAPPLMWGAPARAPPRH